jgi:hypothetical protein
VVLLVTPGHVGNKQHQLWMSTYVCAHAITRTERCVKITNWIAEKCVQAGCLRTSQMITKLVIWGLCVVHLTHDANHGEQFFLFFGTGDETFVHSVTLRTSIWRPWCGNNLYLQ